jgi:hypothetical protein
MTIKELEIIKFYNKKRESLISEMDSVGYSHDFILEKILDGNEQSHLLYCIFSAGVIAGMGTIYDEIKK